MWSLFGLYSAERAEEEEGRGAEFVWEKVVLLAEEGG